MDPRVERAVRDGWVDCCAAVGRPDAQSTACEVGDPFSECSDCGDRLCVEDDPLGRQPPRTQSFKVTGGLGGNRRSE